MTEETTQPKNRERGRPAGKGKTKRRGKPYQKVTVSSPKPPPGTVDKPLAERLRSIVAPPNKKPYTLNELNDAQLCDVYRMISTGSREWSYPKIADYIQGTWGLLRDRDPSWIARSLMKFKVSLSPKDGVEIAASVANSIPDSAKALQAVKAMEKEAKKALNEILALGDQMEGIGREIAHWIAEGHFRGVPFDNYVPKLLESYVKMAQARHGMKKDYGIVKPIEAKSDGLFRQLTVAITERIGGDTKAVTDVMGTLKSRLEEIAEPMQIEQLTTDEQNESELTQQNGVNGEGPWPDEPFDIESESIAEYTGDM